MGFAYLVGVVLGYGVLGAYLGIGLTSVRMALVVAVGFHTGERPRYWRTVATSERNDDGGALRTPPPDSVEALNTR